MVDSDLDTLHHLNRQRNLLVRVKSRQVNTRKRNILSMSMETSLKEESCLEKQKNLIKSKSRHLWASLYDGFDMPDSIKVKKMSIGSRSNLSVEVCTEKKSEIWEPREINFQN